MISWGKKVSQTFLDRVIWIGHDLSISPDDLMNCMAFESGETFSPAIKNGAGSGAVGLIQFMPQTAALLGTTTETLARMSAEDQLNYVWKYFAPYRGRLHNLGDIYMAILWPAGIGKSDDAILFNATQRPTTYLQNKGLDINHDGAVTRREAYASVMAKQAKGRELAA